MNPNTETEAKHEEELAHIADVMRKTYSTYQDYLNRISLDVRSMRGL
jgi:hypothetical protein